MPGFVERPSVEQRLQVEPAQSLSLPGAGRAPSALPPFPGRCPWAHRADNPFEGKRSRSTPAQRAGLVYERKIKKELRHVLDAPAIEDGPWFRYDGGGGKPRYCQPDMLLGYSPKELSIVEIKLRWTADAYWSLAHVYRPVVMRALGNWKFAPTPALVVVTRSYDPAVRVPADVKLHYDWAVLQKALPAYDPAKPELHVIIRRAL